MKKNILIIIIIAVLFSISYFQTLTFYYSNISKNMADPVWGLLPKSQTDAETIEEAIVRLIGEHETDSGAHTGSGESLETHKAQDIIDHPVGSVLADKETTYETVIKCFFESLDGWTTSGTAELDELLGAKLYIEWGVVDVSTLSGVVTYAGNFLAYAKDMLFQTSFWIEETTNTTVHALLGARNSDINLEGFGYQIIDGVVKGFWGDGASPTFTADLSIDATDPHVYRAQYNATDKNVKFYIDGVLKATIEDITPVGDIEPDIYFRYEATDTIDGNMHIKNLTVSREA